MGSYTTRYSQLANAQPLLDTGKSKGRITFEDLVIRRAQAEKQGIEALEVPPY